MLTLANQDEAAVKIRIGYDITYECMQPTAMLLLLNVHYSRTSDLVQPDYLIADPPVPISGYRDSFGNWCTRIVAPPGPLRLRADTVIRDSGLPEPQVWSAREHPVHELPEEALVYLLGSRYCETQLLSQAAWDLFGQVQPGWARVQAVCDYVNRHLTFSYPNARPTRTAWEAWNERSGVCRDFAHLAITLCRCLNIPARYCTSYLGDIGVPVSADPMDFAASIEVYLGDQWYTFDPRNNVPRIGRVLIARGRDATDVAISTSFGPSLLTNFTVITEELS